VSAVQPLLDPRSGRLSIEGPVGPLEAVAEAAGSAGIHAIDACGVICHPHPLYGGTMDNKVVTTVARALADAGIPTLRFNFRGVGASAGCFDRGEGETEDADAAVRWAQDRWPGSRPILAGFSFGGYVAVRLAQRRSPKLLIAVAPAVQYFGVKERSGPLPPSVVIQGDADDVVDPRAVNSWVEALDPKPRLVMLPGVGHFFHGRLGDLREAVREAVRSG
jgi:hypothetical protein